MDYDYEMSAHDEWFRSEVEKALREADSPGAKWVPNEELKRRSAIKRAEWLEKAGAKKGKANQRQQD